MSSTRPGRKGKSPRSPRDAAAVPIDDDSGISSILARMTFQTGGTPNFSLFIKGLFWHTANKQSTPHYRITEPPKNKLDALSWIDRSAVRCRERIIAVPMSLFMFWVVTRSGTTYNLGVCVSFSETSGATNPTAEHKNHLSIFNAHSPNLQFPFCQFAIFQFAVSSLQCPFRQEGGSARGSLHQAINFLDIFRQHFATESHASPTL